MTLRSPYVFDDIGTQETDTVRFDFTSWTTSFLITGMPTVTCEVHAGEDPTPALLVGSPEVDPAGRYVDQRVQGTLDGVTYCLQCTVTIGGMQRTLTGLITSRELC